MDIAYSIMICKYFLILCLLLLLSAKQLPVYTLVWIHLEGILFHILVLSGTVCQIMSASPPPPPCYFVYWLARLVCRVRRVVLERMWKKWSWPNFKVVLTLA